MATNRVPEQTDRVRCAVLAAFERLLTPVARLALDHRIPFQAFVSVAKRVFVRVANNEYNIEGKSQTKSRIALLTGLTRTDVHSVLWDPENQGLPDATRGCRPSALVEGWRQDAFFQDDKGEALPLPIKGKGRSFEALVRRYGADVPPMTMLDELLRAGTVERDEQGQVRLLKRAHIPCSTDSTEVVQAVGKAASHLLDTGVRNIHRKDQDPASAFLQREFWTEGLPPHKVEQFRSEIRQLLERQAEEASEYIQSQEERPIQEGYHRTAGAGFYYFEEE